MTVDNKTLRPEGRYSPITKIVNFWKEPGVMVMTTDWTTMLTPSCTCHHLCSFDLTGKSTKNIKIF